MKLSPRQSGSVLPLVGLLLAVVVLSAAAFYYFKPRRPLAGNTAPAAQAGQARVDGAPAAPAKSGERHLAPHDTFFLLQYVSVKTSTGVIGFEPGQEVHLVEVKRAERKLVVGDGEAQVEVGPEQLTNDLDIAALVRQKDQANQAKVTQYVAAEQRAYENAQTVASEKMEAAADKLNQQQQQNAEREQAKIAANNERREAEATNDNTRQANASSTVGNGSKLDEPPVQVGGGYGGYGYSGNAYYGSPYSYFGGGGTVTAAPAAPTTGGSTGVAPNAASVGAAGRR